MCGIAGLVSAKPLAQTVARDDVARMVEAIAHRGPDDRGVWTGAHAALGHARLSIIDLSAAGHQPMPDESGRYHIVFNGEIYNYKELREELIARGHRFRSSSDTEVLLRSYIEFGPGCLERLNGMWAFVIWDDVERTMFAARDRAGKKPFYYVEQEGSLFFASEMKALFTLGMRFGLNPQAAFDFLTQGTYGHLGADGFFATVRQLPAAHYMTVRAGSAPRIERYWNLPAVARRDRTPYDAAFRTRFRDVFTDAVTIRLRSDVPVGATLSGGLDSSTIVTLVDQITGGAPLHLFTSLYPGSIIDETPFFDAVVERVRQPIIHRATPVEGRFREQLVTVLHHQEEPFGDTSIFAHYHLMEAARRAGVPVVLSGQGGDELMLGYPSLVKAYVGHLVSRGQFGRAWRELDAWTKAGGRSRRDAMLSAGLHALPLELRDRVRGLFVSSRLSRIVTPALRAAAGVDRFESRGGRAMLDAYLAQVFSRFSIPHLTHYDDRNGMAFAVEGRMPFLDYRVVEMLFSVEYDALFHEGVTKRVLRDTFADVLPDTVRLRRDKVGFFSPLARWMRGEIGWIADFMQRERIEHLGVLDAARYLSLLDGFKRGDDRAELEIWRGLIYHLWADRFDVAPLGETVSPTRVSSAGGARRRPPAHAAAL
ncbi:MAG TPA: asparagine synthase (glutamine-hydrolyzing) [Gemmatimonadaceae bacterium]